MILLALLMTGCVGDLRTTAIPVPATDAEVSAAMQSVIARELPSWRGVIAEVGGKPDVAAKGSLLFVSTTPTGSATNGLQDLCTEVGGWAKGVAPSLTNVVVIRSGRELARCRLS